MISSALPNAPDPIEAVPHDQLVSLDFSLRVDFAKRYAKRKEILKWGKMLFPEKFPLPFCKELHGYFCDIRHAELTGTEAPRGEAKTTIKCFLIPIFQALNEPEDFIFYLNVQATDKKALAVNTSIKFELETNDVLRKIYGNQIGKDKWADSLFEMDNGVAFAAISAGQSIRGIQHKNRRPDYIVVDDLYDYEDINNPESTEKKNAWFWSDLYSAKSSSRRVSFHVQGTAINDQDLLKEMSTSPGVVFKSFQAITDWDNKQVLWPELKSFDGFMKLMDDLHMPLVIFMREYQNVRSSDAESKIKSEWLKNWEYDPQDLYARLREGTQLFMVGVGIGNDPSIGEKVENDFTGTALVIKTQVVGGSGNDYWIEGLWNEHLSLDERIKQLETIAAGQPPNLRVTFVNIEAVAGFGDYSSQASKRTNLPIHQIGKDEGRVRDKISNLENKSSYFQNGKVHLNKNIDPKIKNMVKYQLCTNHPKHDDVRDAVLLCLDDVSGLWNFL